jgi:hypothetical protein
MVDTPEGKPDLEASKRAAIEDKDLADVLRCLAEISPHVAQATIKKAEHETARHRNALALWSLPFLGSVTVLGLGVLVLAGMALYRGQAELAQTIVGYLLTYLGGVGTGQLLRNRSG